jgi:hypothetical protein
MLHPYEKIYHKKGIEEHASETSFSPSNSYNNITYKEHLFVYYFVWIQTEIFLLSRLLNDVLSIQASYRRMINGRGAAGGTKIGRRNRKWFE